MRLQSDTSWSSIDQALNVNLKLDSYDLQKNDNLNILHVILDKVVETMASAFVEQHKDELLAKIEISSLSEKIQEKISEELAKAAISKILEK